MSEKTKDQVRLGPTIGPDQKAVIRRRDGAVGSGVLMKVEDGQPIPEGSELIHVGAADDEGWHDVTSLYTHERGGPAQVATPAYRDGYDRIFGKQKVGLA
jgi:hypothetical protein